MLNNDKDYIKEIITDINKLPGRCDEINVKDNHEEIEETIVELKATLRAHDHGIGLAAPQIGRNNRIFVINFNGKMRTFINPIFTHTQDIVLSREGCLSIPGKQYLVPRFNDIKINYQDPLGNNLSSHLIGIAAHAFQHELDHLDGLTLAHIGLEVDEDFDKASDDDKAKIIEMYLDSLKKREQLLDADIEKDPELKKMRDSIKFMEKVQKGEVQLEQREFTEEEKKQLEDKLKETINEEKADQD